MITRRDAIEIYARASRAWYRQNAAHQAEIRAHECRRQNDLDGVEVWLLVKAEVERLDRQHPTTFTVYHA